MLIRESNTDAKIRQTKAGPKETLKSKLENSIDDHASNSPLGIEEEQSMIG